MVKVLMVCTGNICRSPTAEGVLRAEVARLTLEKRIEVASAGTHDYHVGEGADPRTIKAARRRGIDLSRHVARQVSPADFDRFDLMLAADFGHLELLQAMRPKKARSEIALLLDYAPGPKGREVPDPYFGQAQGFERVLDLCAEASAGLCAALARQL